MYMVSKRMKRRNELTNEISMGKAYEQNINGMS